MNSKPRTGSQGQPSGSLNRKCKPRHGALGQPKAGGKGMAPGHAAMRGGSDKRGTPKTARESHARGSR